MWFIGFSGSIRSDLMDLFERNGGILFIDLKINKMPWIALKSQKASLERHKIDN